MLTVIGLLFVAASCCATQIKFPESGEPCIMMDITVHNRLGWTNSSGKTEYVPDWNFTNSNTVDGNCSDNNRHVTRQWDEDNATYTFSFSSKSGQVSVMMDLNFVPDNVFKNGQTDAVKLPVNEMSLSADSKAFLCHNIPEMTASHTTADNDTYVMTVKIESIHVQAFNVENGSYSEDEECAADTTTTEAPVTNHTTETSPMTSPTTPAPTPSANHPKQMLRVYDNNKTCIVLQGEFLFTLPYTKEDGKSGTASVGLQNVSKTTGSCNDSQNTNMIEITFLENWNLSITFMKDGKSGMLGADDTKYWWNELSMTYPLDNKTFPNHMKNESVMSFNKTFDKGQFQATVSGSYLCNADSTLDLGSGAKMETWNLHYKAFQTDNTTTFSDDNVAECKADAKTSSIVPIAVGAALAGLVVIVLIAYLIGRRRNRKGYESV